jgi:hypothetical protein
LRPPKSFIAWRGNEFVSLGFVPPVDAFERRQIDFSYLHILKFGKNRSFESWLWRCSMTLRLFSRAEGHAAVAVGLSKSPDLSPHYRGAGLIPELSAIFPDCIDETSLGVFLTATLPEIFETTILTHASHLLHCLHVRLCTREPMYLP